MKTKSWKKYMCLMGISLNDDAGCLRNANG